MAPSRQRMVAGMRLRGLSEETQRAYVRAMTQVEEKQKPKAKPWPVPGCLRQLLGSSEDFYRYDEAASKSQTHSSYIIIRTRRTVNAGWSTVDLRKWYCRRNSSREAEGGGLQAVQQVAEGEVLGLPKPPCCAALS